MRFVLVGPGGGVKSKKREGEVKWGQVVESERQRRCKRETTE